MKEKSFIHLNDNQPNDIKNNTIDPNKQKRSIPNPAPMDVPPFPLSQDTDEQNKIENNEQSNQTAEYSYSGSYILPGSGEIFDLLLEDESKKTSLFQDDKVKEKTQVNNNPSSPKINFQSKPAIKDFHQENEKNINRKINKKN